MRYGGRRGASAELPELTEEPVQQRHEEAPEHCAAQCPLRRPRGRSPSLHVQPAKVAEHASEDGTNDVEHYGVASHRSMQDTGRPRMEPNAKPSTAAVTMVPMEPSFRRLCKAR